MASGVDRELAAMLEDIAALMLEDRYDKTRTRTAGALARLADFTRGVRSSAGGGNRSSGVSDPTSLTALHGTHDQAAHHHTELTDRLTQAALALKRARAIVEMNYPVPELEPPQWCTSCERIDKHEPTTVGEFCDFCASVKATTKRIPNTKLLERYHEGRRITTKDLRSA